MITYIGFFITSARKYISIVEIWKIVSLYNRQQCKQKVILMTITKQFQKKLKNKYHIPYLKRYDFRSK